MIYAKSEEDFNNALEDMKRKISPDNASLMNYIQSLSDDRGSFANYIIRTYYGCRHLISSNSSEQNHSSIIDHFSGIFKRGQVTIIRFVKELLQRGVHQLNLMNSALAESNIRRSCLKNAIAEDRNISIKDKDLLLPAVDYLCVCSYLLFYEQVSASKKYMVRVLENGVSEVTLVDNHKNTHQFLTKESRCNCETRKAHMLMCRHEISFYGNFRPEFFDICHQFRSQQTFLAVSELDRNVDIENADHENDHTSISIIEHAENGTHNEDECDDDESIVQGTTTSLSVTNHSYQDMQKVFDKVLGSLSRQGNGTKTAVMSIMMELNNIIIEKRTPFVENQLFMATSSFVTDLQRLRSTENVVMIKGTGTKSRLQPIHEKKRKNVSQTNINASQNFSQTVVTKPKGDRTCSFCGSPGHSINLCPTLSSLGDEMTYVAMYDYITQSSPYKLVQRDEMENRLPDGTYSFVCTMVMSLVAPSPSGLLSIDKILLEICALNNRGGHISTTIVKAIICMNFAAQHQGRKFFVDKKKMTGLDVISR